MERKEFDALVSAFEHAYDTLSDKVNTMNPDELNFVPPIADAWSINEHLVHLLDADCNSSCDFRALSRAWKNGLTGTRKPGVREQLCGERWSFLPGSAISCDNSWRIPARNR